MLGLSGVAAGSEGAGVLVGAAVAAGAGVAVEGLEAFFLVVVDVVAVAPVLLLLATAGVELLAALDFFAVEAVVDFLALVLAVVFALVEAVDPVL